MDQFIAETSTREGGSESSGTSDITHDMDQIMADTSTRERRTEPSGTGVQASIIVIPKVRKQLSVIDENSYTPHDVPIGPYHDMFPSSGIEKEKKNSVSHLRKLSEQQRGSGGGLEDLKEELEPLVRAFYPSGWRVGHMTTEQLWTMLLHDGCYLLCCMVDYKGGNDVNNDTSYGMPASSNNAVASTPAGNDQESGGNNVNSGTTPHGTPTSSNNTTALTPTGNDQETSGNNVNSGAPHGMPASSHNAAVSTPTGSDQENSGASDHGTPASSNNTTASTETGNDQETIENNVNNGTPHGTNNAIESSTQTPNRIITSYCGVHNNTVVRDTVFLADNQIPFFVLQKIHERVTGDTTTSSVLKPIAGYVQEVLQAQLYISEHRRPAPPLTPLPSHLLHLLHFYLQPTSPPPAMEENAARPRTSRWRRATEYCKYGNVRFKRRVFKDNEKWTFLDVRLQGGTLWVPRLRVDGMTWTVLRNLMALEELTPNKPVTAYCVFMSQVACKVEDVEFLQDQKILEQFLVNDEEVAQGFANLCKGVVLDIDNDDRNYLKPYWHELETLCNYPRNFMGSFYHKYCRDPVYLAAFIIAGFLFLFELAQVILPLPVVQKHLQ
ncbi:uncharacterized protein LOC111256484 isoform X2 [Setaria italica]|uniref:uncharacterized protein LOC111256484 isoform X2 n=1 Tax=Setaria italica TaxID=4555 RepID=UPI000BE4BB2C|nr:uncharacterized protein LOC111256484 isoform X2 [Setaria italica]